jgi:membrane-bound lytic murein transglycosylase B
MRYNPVSLSRADIIFIKTALHNGVPQQVIARNHNVSQGYISMIARGKRYADIVVKFDTPPRKASAEKYNPHARMNAEKALSAVRMYFEGKKTFREIAGVFGVSISSISRIVGGVNHPEALATWERGRGRGV